MKFHKNKITLEVEVSTQFGPADAIKILEYRLLEVPAIQSLNIVSISSDCEPVSERDENYSALNNVPRKLK